MNVSHRGSSPSCANPHRQKTQSSVSKPGKRPATIALAEAFEQAFGFTFGNIYDRQCELFKRKSYNITKTLDALKGVLVKEFRRREK